MLSALNVQPMHRAAEQCALWLLLAWLPTLAFFGHWSALAAPVMGRAPVHESHATSESHRQHCHAAVADCAGGDSGSVLPVTPALRTGLVPADTGPGAPISNAGLIPAGRSDAPLTPPPRHAR